MANTPIIDYINRDFSSVEDALITYATMNYGASPPAQVTRLWTDFQTSSFSRTWLEEVAYVADCFYFYFDNQATNSYLQTATIQSAVNNIAAQFGFTPAGNTSATGVATYTTTNSGTIPRGARVSATNGDQYYLTNAIIVSGAGSFSGNVLQGTLYEGSTANTFSANGIQNETFNLTGTNVVVDLTNLNALDISPQVTVNGNSYTLVTSFIYSNGTDTPAVINTLGQVIGGGGRVFTLNVNPSGIPFIEFGDGVFGRQLAPADVVVASYRSGGGSAGNIGVGALTTLVDDFSFVTSVTNNAEFSGGTDAESIEQLRDLIPGSLQTLQRAVALNDYGVILTSNFTQVYAASAALSTTPGIDVNIYVVPVGLGIPQITANPNLLQTLANFIDIRKPVTTQFQILNAFGINVIIGMNVYLTNTASQTAVMQSIIAALQGWFTLSTGGPTSAGLIFAQPVLLKDISDLIQTITGIVRFEFTQFTYHPRIDNQALGLTTTYNLSNVTIFPNVENAEWLCGASSASAPGGLFDNINFVPYTVTAGTFPLITYTSTINLAIVNINDSFSDGTTSFTIHSVSPSSNSLTLNTGSTPSAFTSGNHLSGSISANPSNPINTYKVFRKYLATATSLALTSITDNTQSFAKFTGTGAVLSSQVLLDDSNVYVVNELGGPEYLLIDGAGNIWQIVSNTVNTITVGAEAVNNAAVTSVSAGVYTIVQNLIGYNIVFNNNIFSINYNTANTFFSLDADFSLVGNIGGTFEISKPQANVGNFGFLNSITSYTNPTVTLMDTLPAGIDFTKYILVDSMDQIFTIITNPTNLTITVDSDLTPATGTCTITQRYFDDNNEVSFYIGILSGVTTSTDAGTTINDAGLGQVDGTPDQRVDNFVFRTSKWVDDITNLRADEIPQIQASDINSNIFGGVIS